MTSTALKLDSTENVTVSVTEAKHIRLERYLGTFGMEVRPIPDSTPPPGFYLSKLVESRRRWSWAKLMDRVLGDSTRRLLVAALYTNDKQRGAHGTSWVLLVYGESYLLSMQHLAASVSATFGCKIHIRLEAKSPKDCGII